VSKRECAKRIVVKVGSSTLNGADGKLDLDHIRSLVGQIATVMDEGSSVLLVSSGAISAGGEALGLNERPSDMTGLQAAASVGQATLIKTYEKLFKERGVVVGQVLLTRYETTHRQQYLYACRTLERLLELGAVPVVNENDTTAIDEIRFGDNDSLAALSAIMIRADLVLILTDTSGVYTADPRVDESALLLEEIDSVTPELLESAGGPGSSVGSGGMYSKIEAARMLMKAGIPLVIADGRRSDVVIDVAAGERVGTRFDGGDVELSGRKLWIAYGGHAQGTIIVDSGAAHALVEGKKSLLPAGVVRIEGEFAEGDSVTVRVDGGEAIARGLVGMPSTELAKITGLRSVDALELLPGRTSAEVVHRDRLVIL